MNAQLLDILKKLEKADLDILVAGLVPAIFAEIQDLSKANVSVSAIEAVIFPAVEPAVQAALASLVAKIPGQV